MIQIDEGSIIMLMEQEALVPNLINILIVAGSYTH